MYGKFREQSPKWNPNLTDNERLKKRGVKENEEWREKIYKKYNYTCAICGDSKGGNLNAHHLNSYTAFPKERFNIDNGVCLCEKCHNDFHKTYGYGNNTKEQYKQWYKKYID